MKIKMTSLIGAMGLALSLGNSTASAQGFSTILEKLDAPVSVLDRSVAIDAGADIYSHYVWRGYILATKPVVQPTITFRFGDSGVAFNVWGSAAVQERGAPENLKEADELDFILSFDRSLGEEREAVGLSLGYIRYTLPNLAGTQHSEEIYGGFSLDNSIAPSMTVYYDFGLADAFYVTAGIGPEFSLDNEGMTNLSFEASIGFSGAAESFAFNDFTVLSSIGVNLEAFTICPAIGFSYADDAVNIDNSEFWGGVSISFSR